jgi:hypothetical protein
MHVSKYISRSSAHKRKGYYFVHAMDVYFSKDKVVNGHLVDMKTCSRYALVSTLQT